MTDTLLYVDGSPFARLIRVLSREWGLGLREEELTFPLPADHFDHAPLGQVPVLISQDQALFPTAFILDHLSEASDNPIRDKQALATTLSFTDALVSAFYQIWAGLGPQGPNALGFDPAERNLARVTPFLDWITPRISPEDPDVAEFALAVILIWTESRHPIDWRGRKVLEALVAQCQARNSFLETEPKPWSPD